MVQVISRYELIKPGGFIILEGFSIGHLYFRNLNPEDGGPNKAEMLFSEHSTKSDFKEFNSKKSK